MSDAPKSRMELVMERLRKQDAEAGIDEKPLTDAQRAAIAEARSVYEAQVAERRIMHQSTVSAIFDPEELAAREGELRPVAGFVGDRLENHVADRDESEQNQDANSLTDIGGQSEDIDRHARHDGPDQRTGDRREPSDHTVQAVELSDARRRRQ